MTNLVEGLKQVQEALEMQERWKEGSDQWERAQFLKQEALALIPSLIEQAKGMEKELREAALTELVRESELLGLYGEPQPPKEGER